jgi:hypothetical protein
MKKGGAANEEDYRNNGANVIAGIAAFFDGFSRTTVERVLRRTRIGSGAALTVSHHAGQGRRFRDRIGV